MTTLSRHSATAVLDTGQVLHCREVEVTLDRNWSPYAQATLVMPIPDAETRALLDPRQGARVTLTLRQDFGAAYTLSALTSSWPLPATLADISAAYAGATLADLTDQYRNELNPNYAIPSATRPLDLGVREFSLDARPGLARLSLESDEALMQDDAPTGTSPIVLGYTSLQDAVEYALARLGATLAAGAVDATVEADATTWEPGVSAWDFLEPLTQKAGRRLWCDESRVWRLEESTRVLPGAVVLSWLTTLTEAQDTLSRAAEDWCDAVVVKYEWTDGAGARQTAYDSAVAPGGGSKVRLITHTDKRYPGPGAAANILRHQANRGRTLEIQAVNSYDATPGTAAIVTTEHAPTQTGIVAGVTWRMPADTMQVRFRDLTDTPDGAYVLANPTMTYDDAPAVAYADWLNPDGV